MKKAKVINIYITLGAQTFMCLCDDPLVGSSMGQRDLNNIEHLLSIILVYAAAK